MQTPYRKPSKYSNLKPDPNITASKFKELQEKLEYLEKVSRPREAAEVARLAEMGDFSENAAYQIAKGRLRGINQKIIDITNHLKVAKIIKAPIPNGRVQIGSVVILKCNNKEKTYQILGSSETDPLKGIISSNSPLGKELLGHKEKDTITIKTANKTNEYQIIKIS